MAELTKKQTTDEFADIYVTGIPSDKAEIIKEAIEKILALAGLRVKILKEDNRKLYSIEEVFPEYHTGHALRGLRRRENLTQKQLAEMIGAKPSHISEMENGKRPIGKDMARRLAKALRTDYKVFL